MLPEGYIEDVCARADIVDVIDRRVPLKKRGKGYTACCPFHDEKSPSFNVNAEKQFYYCFGCGAGGDAIHFLMALERIPFVEAVSLLARSIGMDAPAPADAEALAAQAAARDARRKAKIAEAEAERLAEQQRVCQAAQLVWGAAQKTGKSDYLVRKQVGAFGVRFLNKTVLLAAYPDRYDLLTGANIKRFLDENNQLPEHEQLPVQRFFARSIVVPLVDAEGTLWNVQVIPEKPGYKKMFLKNGRKKGLYSLLKKVDDPAVLLVAEGYATGASLLMATGIPVALAFDSGNFPESSKTLRARFPNVAIVACGDNDAESQDNPGKAKAQEAANEVGGAWVVPMFKGAA